MNLSLDKQSHHRRTEAAFNLPEVVIAMVIIGTLLVALYAAFNAGFAVMKSARESLRATQILIQRAEVIRLYNWSQLRDTNKFLKPFFVEYYDPLGAANGKYGVQYVGTVRTNGVPFSSVSYATNMRTITISVFWTNQIGKNKITMSRKLDTYQGKYGIQNYVYGPP